MRNNKGNVNVGGAAAGAVQEEAGDKNRQREGDTADKAKQGQFLFVWQCRKGLRQQLRQKLRQ